MSKRAHKNGKAAADALASPPVADPAEPAAPPPDPALGKAKSGVNHWAANVESTVRAMEQVHATLRVLAARNDRDQRELQRLNIEAGIVASLNLDELKAYREAVAAGADGSVRAVGTPSGAPSQQQGKRAGSAGRGRRSIGGATKTQRTVTVTEEASSGAAGDAESAAEGQRSSLGSGPAEVSITALDEKKRHKIRQQLLAAYRSNPPAPPLSAGMSPVKPSGAVKAQGQRSVPASKGSGQKAAMPSPGPPPELGQGGEIDLTSPLGQPLPMLAANAVPDESSPSKHSTTSTSSAPSLLSTPGAQRATAVTATTSVSDHVSISSLGAHSGTSDPRRPREVSAAVWDELLAVRSRRIALEAHVDRTNSAVVVLLEKLAVLQEQVMVARYGLKTAFDAFVRAGGLKEEVPPPQPTSGSRPSSRSASSRGRGSSMGAAASSSARVGAR